MPTAGLFVLFALSFLAAIWLMPKVGPNAQIGLLVGAGLTALLAVALAVQSLFADTDAEAHDGSLRDRATRRLKAKGKGDTYFTQAEYDIGFLKKSPTDPTPARHKTAAELLEGTDGDDRPTRRRRK